MLAFEPDQTPNSFDCHVPKSMGFQWLDLALFCSYATQPLHELFMHACTILHDKKAEHLDREGVSEV